MSEPIHTPHAESTSIDTPHEHAAVDGHGHSHGHGHGPLPRIATSLRARVITLALLALVAAATVFGIIQLRPDFAAVGELAEQTPYAIAGATFETGEVLGVESECASAGATGDPNADGGGGSGSATAASCLQLSVGIHTGPDTGRVVDVEARGALAASGIRAGDRIELVRHPSGGTSEGAPGEAVYQLSQSYTASGVFRHVPLAILALLFIAVVVAVGRLRGLLALVALGISAGVLLAFVLPALLSGRPGLLVGVVGASAIMFVILYLVHGPNMRTTAALVGTLCGILIMAGVSLVAVHITRLSGMGDESSALLSAVTGTLDFRGLLTCSIIIAGLGVLNDVTITQASSVWELRAAAPAMPSSEVHRRAMRIGRDHIASTVYTVFFAYVGAALSVLIMLYLYGLPFLSLLTREDIAVEIVRTLCGSIGLVLAVPITTWVATLFARSSDAH